MQLTSTSRERRSTTSTSQKSLKRLEREAQGLCSESSAHGPALVGKLCALCAAARHEAVGRTRAKNVAAGLCYVSAAHGPAAPGRKKCAACLKSDRDRKKAQDKQRLKEVVGLRTERNEETGLCAKSASHGPAAPGRKRCRRCLDQGSKRAKRALQKSKRLGLCRISRAHGPATKCGMCAACYARHLKTHNAARNKRADEGLCRTSPGHGKALFGHKLCGLCVLKYEKGRTRKNEGNNDRVHDRAAGVPRTQGSTLRAA